jgi:hypothetical protein
MACRARLPVVCALVAASASFTASAQDPPAKPAAAAPAGDGAKTEGTKAAARVPMESLLPANSLLFAGIDSVEQTRADWAASAWGRLMADPANETVRASFTQLLDHLSEGSKKEAGFDFVETVGWVTGRAGLGMFGEMGAREGADFGFTAGLESPDHIAELRERAQKILDKTGEDGEYVLKHETEGDVEVSLMVPKQGSHGDFDGDLRVAAAGPVLLVDGASGAFREKPNFRDALAALRGEAKDPLSAAPSFKSSLAAHGGGLKIWFDTGRLIRADLASGSGSLQSMRILGVDEFGPLSARLLIDAKELHLEAQQAWSEKCALAGLLGAWLAGSDWSLFKMIPAEAEHALALHLDFAKGMDATDAFRKANGLAADAPPPDAAGGDPAAAAAAPPDLRKDFLDHLDGRIAIFAAQVDPSEAIPLFGAEGPPISMCAVVGVKAAEPLRASLDRAMRMVGLHAARKKSEFQGFEVYSVPVMPFTLHYAILDDFAVISLSPTLLQDVLRRKSDKELKNLATDASFKREVEGLSSTVSLLVWEKVDPKLFATIGAQAAAEVAMGRGPDHGNPVERALFGFVQALGTIDPAVAAKHLPPGSVFGLGVDASGLHLEGVSR